MSAGVKVGLKYKWHAAKKDTVTIAGLARDGESNEPMVLYTNDRTGGLFARKASEFLGTVTNAKGQKVSNFTLVG